MLRLETGAELPVVHHRPSGGRSTFLFVNSSGATAAAWEAGIAPLLRAGGWGTLSVDLRGQGESRYPEGSTFETEEIVRDLELVLEELEVDDCIPVGLSVGGLRAAELALLRPGATPGLVLINVLREKGPLIEWLCELETRLMAIGGAQLVHDAFRPTTVSPERLGQIRATHLRDGPYVPMAMDHPRRRLAEGAKRADWGFDWSRLTMPVLVMTGMHDRLFRVQKHVDAILATMPNAREVPFDNEGHALHTENPGRVAQVLTDFAETIFSSRSSSQVRPPLPDLTEGGGGPRRTSETNGA